MLIRETLEGWAQVAIDQMFDWRRYGEPTQSARPPIVAHRGAWNKGELVENTLPAFRRARELGAWAIEFDIRFTRDGVPVVHHDATLSRCHRHPGSVAEMSFMELRSAAPLVPSLQEVLALRGLHFMIELKTPLEKIHVLALVDALKALRPVEDYHLLSLRPDLVRIHSALPEKSWVLVGDIWLLGLAREVKRRGLGGVAGHYLAMTKGLLGDLHDAGMQAGSGFAPSRNLYCREWGRGVDWVFTNAMETLALYGTKEV